MQTRWAGQIIGMIFPLLVMVVFGCGGLGCGVKSQITDVRLNSTDYAAVFDSTLDAAREAGFRLDRVDRRFGVITSTPLDAGSVLEPWRNRTATAGQAMESTFNYERRVIRITFEPASGKRAMGGMGKARVSGMQPALAQVEPRGSAAMADEEISSYEGTLRVNVQCMIERAHRPGRRIETTTVRRSSYTVDPSLAGRGIAGQFWEPVARDPYMEQQVLQLLVGDVGAGVLVVEGVDAGE